MKLQMAGDSSVFIRTGDEISSDLSNINKSIIDLLIKSQTDGIIEVVASYLGVMVYFDPLIIGYSKIEALINDIKPEHLNSISETGRGIIVPVVYGGDYGPDLEHIANLNGITADEVSSIHSSGKYVVHMLGFTPGFPYIGGMDKRLSSPRKTEPSLKIEAGSVGIAGDQTCIYPVESPGGWQIVGRTPLVLFDAARKPEFLFRAGMQVRFRAISINEFWLISEEISSGEYNIEEFTPGIS